MDGSTPIGDVLALDRRTEWSLDSNTPVKTDVGHPQGLTQLGENWLVTTIHPNVARAEVLLLDSDGEVLHRLDLTDGPRCHPGGIHCSGVDGGIWIPIAEYRAHSTTTVVHLDRDLGIDQRFIVDDHLGAICNLSDGTLLAVSWGSRVLYRLSTDGDILDQRANPSHVFDYQDLNHSSSGHVIASGVAETIIGGTALQLGGLAVLGTDDLRLIHEVPVAASMPSGRSITYNGFHLENSGTTTAFHCLVDDVDASIGHWSVR